MAETLIERLKRRIAIHPSIDMHHLADIRPRPPATAVDIIAAEELLGFELPTLVRDLYTEVGDGGYGPGYGLDCLAEVVVESRQFQLDTAGAAPRHFLHLCHWGCGYFSGLDCSRPNGVVFRYVPDEDDNPESLRPEAESFDAWLDASLGGEWLWDRVKLQLRDIPDT